jgi:hypothetical protein
MAEVKSTLEIALEKAKNMEISSDERRRFKHEAMVSRARDIFQNHMNNFHRSDIIRQALKESLEDAPLLRQCLTELLVGALEPGQSSERIWEGLRELGLSDTGPFEKALTRIAENDARSRRETAQRIKERVRRSLAEAGISGTAVDIRVEASDRCKTGLSERGKKSRAELDAIRTEIAEAIGRRSSSPQ